MAEPLLAALLELSRRGYLIVLDDFVLGEHTPEIDALLELAAIIKIEIPNRPDGELNEQVTRLRRFRARLVAEQVETHADFQPCLALGFDLDRTSVVWGKGVSVRVDLGGRGILKKKQK